MIAISAVLVIVATVTLVIGIFQSGLTFIGISIASSVAAFAALVLGVVRGRKEPGVATEPTTEQFPAARAHEAIPAEAEANPVVPLLLEEDDEDEAGGESEDEEEAAEEADEPLQPLRFDAGAARTSRSPSRSGSRSTSSRAKPATTRAKSAKSAAKKTTASRSKSTAAKKTTAKPSKSSKTAKPAARKPAARKPATRKPATRRPSDSE